MNKTRNSNISGKNLFKSLWWFKALLFDSMIWAYLAGIAALALFDNPLKSEDKENLAQFVPGLAFNFFMLVLAGLILSFVLSLSQSSRLKSLGQVLFFPRSMRQNEVQESAGILPDWYQCLWGIQALMLVSVTLGVGFIVTQFSFQALFDEETFYPAMRLLGQLFSPDWKILPQAVLHMMETVYIAFMATAIAVPVAFVLSFLAARNIMTHTWIGSLVYTFLRGMFNISRSIEPIIWAIVFSLWVGFGPFAGMLALMINSIPSLAKQYSEYIEGVDEGPVEGIRATGAGTLQTLWFAVVPQVVLPYISYSIYRLDTNVRMATIIGFVGGGGIGKMLIENQLQGRWPQVGVIILVIAAVVWMMDTFSSYVREAVK